MSLSKSDFYKGVGDELVGRLQARNRVLLSFITVSSTIIGISAAEKGIAFTGVGIGFLSLATTWLSRHHELMIAHLFAYQKSLIGTADEKLPFVPWHEFQVKQIAKTRNMRDWAQLFLHLLLMSVSLLISGYREFSSPTPPEGLHDLKVAILATSWICGIVSLVIIYTTMQEREEILTGGRT
jgi:hypothetical protein